MSKTDENTPKTEVARIPSNSVLRCHTQLCCVTEVHNDEVTVLNQRMALSGEPFVRVHADVLLAAADYAVLGSLPAVDDEYLIDYSCPELGDDTPKFYRVRVNSVALSSCAEPGCTCKLFHVHHTELVTDSDGRIVDRDDGYDLLDSLYQGHSFKCCDRLVDN